VTLVERELGWTSYALQALGARPSNILQAYRGGQVETYLLPTIRGERHDCLAMTEPGAGSDVRSMTTRARREGGDWMVNGTKHFISHADTADFVVLFAVTAAEQGRGASARRYRRSSSTMTPRGSRSAAAHRRSPTAATTTASCRSPTAGCPAPRCSVLRVTGSFC